MEKDYRFDTEHGEKTLAELFEGRSQLLVYHFMFGPSYEAGCPVNSSIADSVDGVLPHLHARDVTFTLVSQAPIEKLQAYRRRMGWSLPWASSAPGDFNFDLGYSQTEEESREAVAQIQLPAQASLGDAFPPIVEHNARASGTDIVGYLTESPGFTTFVRDGEDVYQAYSTTWRGLEFVMTYYPILDHAPKGRARRRRLAALDPPSRRVRTRVGRVVREKYPTPRVISSSRGRHASPTFDLFETGRVEGRTAMQQIRIEKPKVRRDRWWLEVLPLDPRDPDIVRAKCLARATCTVPRPSHLGI
jgi:predicted dithiol-disulfide oxidoreductase (DUF899 family)